MEELVWKKVLAGYRNVWGPMMSSTVDLGDVMAIGMWFGGGHVKEDDEEEDDGLVGSGTLESEAVGTKECRKSSVAPFMAVGAVDPNKAVRVRAYSLLT